MSKIALLSLALFGTSVAMAMTFVTSLTPAVDDPEPLDEVTVQLDEGPAEPYLIFDTARYTFGYDDESHGMHGGGQNYGSTDKVGIHRDVSENYDNVDSDANVIEADNVPRELLAVEDHGIVFPEEFHWHVRIWSVELVEGVEQYKVVASAGFDPISSRTSHLFHTLEMWERRDGLDPILISRKVLDNSTGL